jgi:hypothetical protein
VVQFHGPYGEDTYSTQWTFVANRLRWVPCSVGSPLHLL